MSRVDELMELAEALVYAACLCEKHSGDGPRVECTKARTELRTALSACVAEWLPESEFPDDVPSVVSGANYGDSAKGRHYAVASRSSKFGTWITDQGEELTYVDMAHAFQPLPQPPETP